MFLVRIYMLWLFNWLLLDFDYNNNYNNYIYKNLQQNPSCLDMIRWGCDLILSIFYIKAGCLELFSSDELYRSVDVQDLWLSMMMLIRHTVDTMALSLNNRVILFSSQWIYSKHSSRHIINIIFRKLK